MTLPSPSTDPAPRPDQRPGPAAGHDLPIADYGLLSDCHSAALVSRYGSIDWLSFPRFDSPSVLGRLLGPDAGHWSIRPDGPFEVRRRYLRESLVLESELSTAEGTVVITDGLVFAAGSRGHDIGHRAPHALVRMVRVSAGTVAITAELRPRPEYGLVQPRLRMDDDGVLLCRGGAELLTVSGPEPDHLDDGTAHWCRTLSKGEQMVFALRHHPSWTGPSEAAEAWTQHEAAQRLADTVEAWCSWSELHQSYDGPARDLVHHSGRVLQGLTYQPSGAIVAAATTSLPETVGGGRNWDYRFAWVRDASFTMQALWVAACPDEAALFLRWMVDTVGTSVGQAHGMQIMYGVGGEHDLSERELAHLPGWRASAPVRVGNGAWSQRQIDIYGELLDCIWRLREQMGDDPPAEARELLCAVADAAADAWPHPDSGIWEQRGEPRHYVYSKLMCWVALDRAGRLAGWLGAEADQVERWETEANTIRRAILDRGWSDQRQSFAQTFEGDQLDSSVLMLGITGFLDADDPRMRATVDRIAAELAGPNGLLYRYEGDDGLDGGEGSFLLCSYWLVECLAAGGDEARARALFERCNALANDLGLLSEEVDAHTGELLGNFPQAFSHVGLVNAAWALAQRSPTRGAS